LRRSSNSSVSSSKFPKVNRISDSSVSNRIENVSRQCPQNLHKTSAAPASKRAPSLPDLPSRLANDIPPLTFAADLHTTLKRRATMPMVKISLIENVFSKEQKREMIEKVTDAMVSIEGESMRGVTWVILEEILEGDWGIGGQGLTSADVHKLQSSAA
jgi:4-oxalocrotonate tautomerase